jgi:DNA mismatch repair protein MutS2
MVKTVAKLDLTNFIDDFSSYFSRKKSFELLDSIEESSIFIKELENIIFYPPPKVVSLDEELKKLKKLSILNFEIILEFVKIIKYFQYLKNQAFIDTIKEWLINIKIPEDIIEIVSNFDKKLNILNNIELDTINKKIQIIDNQIKDNFNNILSSTKLKNYLQTFQIHYINNQEAILVKSGYQNSINGKIIGRSGSGYFYVVPNSVVSLKNKKEELLDKKDEIIYKICKEISIVFNNYIQFLIFINKSFDKFDSCSARVLFAKANNYNLIIPNNEKRDLKIVSYCHPAINNPKPIDVEFNKKILLITGVNAGGKTMLLKSILSTILLSKNLIPMNINISSVVPNFKKIIPILDDPQNVTNDISTFAGRMVEFEKLFSQNSMIVGIDEIEIGTDSNEAAILFYEILKHLKEKDIKIIVTTHHKQLAMMLSDEEGIDLLAATYDHNSRLPTYSFLHGVIGKSYAFETASRYGIPDFIVQNALNKFTKNEKKLDSLVQKSFELKQDLERKQELLDIEIENIKEQTRKMQEREEAEIREFNSKKIKLEQQYKSATDIVKYAINKNAKLAHKKLNEAHKVKQNITTIEKKEQCYNVGESVKYFETVGVITSISSQNKIFIELDNGKKVVTNQANIRQHKGSKTVKYKTNINIKKLEKSSTSINIHGLRGEDAMDKLDIFLSKSLVSGFDEVLVVHGIGSGILIKLTKQLLSRHPRVKNYYNAPANMGGIGATIVEF